MEDVSDYYERRLEKPNWGILHLIEPILILLVIALVGVMILALYLPLFNMGGDIK